MKNGFLKNKTATSSLSKARSIITKNGISINKAATSIISSETTTSIKTNKKTTFALYNCMIKRRVKSNF